MGVVTVLTLDRAPQQAGRATARTSAAARPARAPQPGAQRLTPSTAMRLQRLAGNAAVAHALAHPGGRTAPADQPVEAEPSFPPRPVGTAATDEAAGVVQRTIGDGHDLRNGRFAGDATLEAAFDDERHVRFGSSGPGVEKLQRAMVDIGLSLPKFGVDGKFGAETKSRVEVFQRSAGIVDDGIVGPITMGEFDRRIPGIPPPAPPVLTSATVAVAPDGGANTRLRVGPGELVDLTASVPVTWTAPTGTLTVPVGPATRWSAPETGTVTITATPATGPAASLTFTVVPPDAFTMTRAVVNPIPAGSAGADMLTDVDFGHRDVSFAQVQWLEDPGPPSGVTGYFLVGNGSAMDLNHHPNPAFVTLRADNHFLHDHCGSGFPLAPPFFRIFPSPSFFGGGWTWVIPNRFRIVGSGTAGTPFFTSNQVFSVDSFGTTTVSKEGATITRTRAGAVT